jgi:cytochrome c oxidase subunit 2
MWPGALDPHGAGARDIAWLFWFFTLICAVVWMLVLVGLAIALLRHRAAGERLDFLVAISEKRERLSTWITEGAVALTAVILAGFTASSYLVNKSLAMLASEDALTIQVTGWQWWWNIRYPNSDPSRTVETANELHVPVGRPVRLELAAGDVIHSFWVPEIAGKEDLVPGRQNLLALKVEKPGIYRGQCAEFCGLQHAHMSLIVVAEEQEQFDLWLNRQLKSAEEPANDEAKRGRDVFLLRPCVMCHTIAGTQAASRAGPDLTHIASRNYLAAGALPNTRGSLAAWIADPQSIKPGVKMPSSLLSPDELNAVVAYLETLK